MELSYPIHLLTLPSLQFSSSVAATMMFLHCIIGLIAAAVASRKGADAVRWIVWGLIGGTIALIAALSLSPRPPEP